MATPSVGNTGTGPAYVASSTATSAVLGVPSGLVVGDLMVLVMQAQASIGITWTVPSGWVEVISGGRLRVWTKRAATADLSTGPTISRSTSDPMGWDAKVTHIIDGRSVHGADRVAASGTSFTAATPVPTQSTLLLCTVERNTGTAAITASNAHGFSLVANYGNAGNQGRGAMFWRVGAAPVTPMEFSIASSTDWQSIAFAVDGHTGGRRGLGLIRG